MYVLCIYNHVCTRYVYVYMLCYVCCLLCIATNMSVAPMASGQPVAGGGGAQQGQAQARTFGMVSNINIFTVMEDIVDKLKIINYESLLLARRYDIYNTYNANTTCRYM